MRLDGTSHSSRTSEVALHGLPLAQRSLAEADSVSGPNDHRATSDVFVCCWGFSGSVLLVASFTADDPHRLSQKISFCIAPTVRSARNGPEQVQHRRAPRSTRRSNRRSRGARSMASRRALSRIQLQASSKLKIRLRLIGVQAQLSTCLNWFGHWQYAKVSIDAIGQ